MRQTTVFLTVLLVTTAAPQGIGQTANARAGSADHPVLTFGFGPGGSSISSKPNAPFSAIAVERFEQTLNDGTNISRENQETVMRDSAGRIYRGRELKRPAATNRLPLIFFTIADPVKHVQFRCLAFSKHCTEFDYREFPRNGHLPLIKHLRDVTVEDLGEAEISGLQVVGQRTTRIIPEGSNGNDRPFTTTQEV